MHAMSSYVKIEKSNIFQKRTSSLCKFVLTRKFAGCGSMEDSFERQNNEYRLSDHGDRDITCFLRVLFYENVITEKKGYTDQSDGKRENGACEAY